MNFQVNGWFVLLLLGALLISYGFAYLMMHNAIPLIAAQIAGNQQVVAAVNNALQQQTQANDNRFTRIETRLETLEKNQ